MCACVCACAHMYVSGCIRELGGGRVCMCVYLSSGTFTCVKCVYLDMK